MLCTSTFRQVPQGQTKEIPPRCHQELLHACCPLKFFCTSKAGQEQSNSLKERFPARLKQMRLPYQGAITLQNFKFFAEGPKFLCQVQSLHHSRAKVNYHLHHPFTLHCLPTPFHVQTIGTQGEKKDSLSANEKRVSVVAVFTNSVIIYLNQIPTLSIYFTSLFKSGQASFYCQ